MNSSDLLYYMESNSSTKYEETPTGDIDINRLLQGDSHYWRASMPLEANKKKKLILADWRAEFWSRDKISRVKNKFETLLKDGFDIFIWTHKQRITLTIDTLSTLDVKAFRHCIDPCTPAEAKRALDTSEEKLTVLDDYQLDWLLMGSKPPLPRSISFYEYKANSHRRGKIDAWINQNPDITHLLLNEWTDSNDIVDNQNIMPNALVVTEAPCRHIYLRATPTIEKNIDFNSIESIALSYSNIDMVLRILPKLTKMSLFNCHNMEADLCKLQKNDWPALEKIMIFCSTEVLSPIAMKHILEAAPHLQQIGVSSSKSDLSDAFIHLQNNSLPTLSEIKLDAQIISTNAFIALLKAAPNLMLANATPKGNITGAFSKLPPNHLRALESFRFVNNAPSAVDIVDLIKVAPKLQEIRLHSCSMDKTMLSGFSIHPSPFLKKIFIHDTTVPDNFIDVLRQAAPHLEELSFMDNQKKNFGVHSLRKNSLPDLKTIRIDKNRNLNDPADIIVLIQAAPNLTYLALQNCGDLDRFFNRLQKNDLLHLKKIDLCNSTVSQAGIIALDNAAPNLNYIYLNSTSPLNQPDNQCDNANDFHLRATIIGPNASRYAAASSRQIEPQKPAKHTHATSPKNGGSKKKIDAATNPQEITYNISTIFYPRNQSAGDNIPAPNSYRLDVFHELNINPETCDAADAFLLERDNNLELRSVTVPHTIESESDESDYFMGYYEIVLSDEWQALPSLSPNDTLKALYITQKNAHYTVSYSDKTNLYYIKNNIPNTPPQKVNIEFCIKAVLAPKNSTLPPNIQSDIHFWSEFGAGALSIGVREPTGKDYLDAMNKQHVGACRHRAVAFKANADATEQYLEIPSRIITNDIHAYVEIQYNNIWYTIDLGGYPATCNLQDTNREHFFTQNNAHEQAARNHVLQESMSKSLATWEKKSGITNELHYLQQCVSVSDTKKQLIEFESVQQSDGFSYQLRDFCREVKKPVFYAHNANDLVCSAAQMKASTDNKGIIQKGPAGPLHAFLSTHQEGLLIVNYSNFSPEELVRFNSLLDQTRKADTTEVPEGIQIVGLLHQDTVTKPGSDFYSRFDKVETCPITPKPLFPKPPTSESTEGLHLHLYHANDWKSQLLGQFVPKQGQWHYEPGLLQQLLPTAQTGDILHIHNGLWEDPDFCHFWEEVQHTKEIKTPKGIIAWPDDLKLAQQEGYSWEEIAKAMTVAEHPDEKSLVLNPTTAHQFFQQYAIQGTHLDALEGKIANAARQTPKMLHVTMTHNMSEHLVARLLTTAKQHGVQISAFCAPLMTLPKAIKVSTLKYEPIIQQISETLPTCGVITTNDADATITLLNQKHPDAIFIECSELTTADLFSKINCKISSTPDSPLHIEFSETQCALNHALARGKQVILYGNMPAHLSQALAPLFLAKTKGLLLVSNDNAQIAYLPTRYSHDVTDNLKRDLLRQQLPGFESSIDIGNTPFVHLLAKAKSMMRNQDPDKLWQGLNHINADSLDAGSLKIEDGTYQSTDWVKERKKAIHDILATEPFVFISGLSGVGKSTFINNEFSDKSNTIYHDETSIEKWANDHHPDTQKILFIDEANLSPKQWSQFEGLFRNRPSIIIQGQYVPVSQKHKVIFAGNPINYGDERTLAPLFARHGNAVQFDLIPAQVIFERILKPLFKDSSLAEKAYEISSIILKAYQFLCAISTKDILISSRELEMMALCTLAYMQKNPSENPLDVAEYFTFNFAKTLVPQAHLAAFTAQWREGTQLKFPRLSKHNEDYLVTPSREQPTQYLESFLLVRDNRLTANTKQRQYGGLGGIIIEGEPGIGKSEFVTHTLIAQGYHELKQIDDHKGDHKHFYHLSISMPLAEKETILRNAFNQGIIVIIDEINSSPMMERLLNTLLMGKTPEGKEPARPGFMIIGTQNPPTMAGRRAVSTALKRRTLFLSLEPYPKEEMIQILQAKGLSSNDANLLADTFMTQKEHAQDNQLEPEPTVRDLLRIAKKLAQYQLQHQPVSGLNALIYQIKALLNTLNDSSLYRRVTSDAVQITQALVNQLDKATILFAKQHDMPQLSQDCLNAIDEAMEHVKAHNMSAFDPFLTSFKDFIKNLNNPTPRQGCFFVEKAHAPSAHDLLILFKQTAEQLSPKHRLNY